MARASDFFMARSASSSTRPASVRPNCASKIRLGSFGFRLTQCDCGGSASQVKNAFEAWLAVWSPTAGSAVPSDACPRKE